MLSRTKEQGGEEALRWQRVRLRDRLLLLNKAFTRASLKCGASSAFASDPGGVPDIPAFKDLIFLMKLLGFSYMHISNKKIYLVQKKILLQLQQQQHQLF